MQINIIEQAVSGSMDNRQQIIATWAENAEAYSRIFRAVQIISMAIYWS
ncbi:hypothetical protein T10_7587 [Trichinella papuae]|uniref:Uncharacterized protein n=1 Tax=Trichinella papuae TaxID=268474 RepID=A0A0V1MJ45_9BILA|nr:hypothetical protein T10_7587 [Trichinella papuae]